MSAPHKRSSYLQQGFTLIEMMIVLSIVCIIAPLCFLTLSHTSDEQKMHYFSEDIRETISAAQMDALSKSVYVQIVFNTADHFYTISTGGVDGAIERRDLDSRIRITSNTNKLSILITRTGSFANPGTFSFRMGSIWYNLILEIGQGRFHIDKIS